MREDDFMRLAVILLLGLLLSPVAYYGLNYLSEQELNFDLNPKGPGEDPIIIAVEVEGEYWELSHGGPHIMYFDFDDFNVELGAALIFEWTMSRGRFSIYQNGWEADIIVSSEINGSFIFIPLSRAQLILDCMMFDWHVGITIIHTSD